MSKGHLHSVKLSFPNQGIIILLNRKSGTLP